MLETTCPQVSGSWYTVISSIAKSLPAEPVSKSLNSIRIDVALPGFRVPSYFCQAKLLAARGKAPVVLVSKTADVTLSIIVICILASEPDKNGQVGSNKFTKYISYFTGRLGFTLSTSL